jgi:hypothetical protein
LAVFRAVTCLFLSHHNAAVTTDEFSFQCSAL